MNSPLILDTNILVHMVRGDITGQHVKAVYEPLMIEPKPLISVVTDGELRSLSIQFSWRAQKVTHAQFLLSYFDRVTIDRPEILKAYAFIDSHSKAIGRSMGKNDLWIAATANFTGATLLTTDNDFDHLDGLFLDVRRIDETQPPA